MIASARGITDTGRSTLVILGGSGTGTGCHLDRTEAYNIAFSVGKEVVPLDTVLAVWVFINPLLVGFADAWVKGNLDDCPAGFESYPDENRVHLKDDDLARFMAYMAEVGQKESVQNPVVKLEQRPGQLVHFAAGWVHQVTNVRPNVKVAWDMYDANNLHQYVELQHKIASKYFKGAMADDYMSVNMVLGTLCNNI
jgi:hypothetical protein